jgi:lipopolysaccharide/colanic/teichoic acid biosynthesis glycosyltransferase
VVENGIDVYERLTGTLPLESLTPGALVFSDAFRRSPLSDVTARAISIVVAIGGLVGSAPLFALIALAIKLDSPGPVLFVHDRIGRDGRPFKLVKFRTMRPAGPGTSEWVRDNSERITRVGKWLRRFRLDELPQFVNIVQGDMNLVGPRPHPLSNLELFEHEIPYYEFRTGVRPGVTGWAQVRYGYANTLAEEVEKMRYDLYYVKHGSLWFDLRILVDTVKIVLFGRGSKAADAYPAGAR